MILIETIVGLLVLLASFLGFVVVLFDPVRQLFEMIWKYLQKIFSGPLQQKPKLPE